MEKPHTAGRRGGQGLRPHPAAPCSSETRTRREGRIISRRQASGVPRPRQRCPQRLGWPRGRPEQGQARHHRRLAAASASISGPTPSNHIVYPAGRGRAMRTGARPLRVESRQGHHGQRPHAQQGRRGPRRRRQRPPCPTDDSRRAGTTADPQSGTTSTASTSPPATRTLVLENNAFELWPRRSLHRPHGHPDDRPDGARPI